MALNISLEDLKKGPPNPRVQPSGSVEFLDRLETRTETP